MNQGLSIAIITKNNPQKLARCLQSVARQTIKPHAVLVVDNDINKTAFPVIKLFQKKISTLIYIYEPNTTVPDARNKAIAECKTAIIGFTDDDCVLDPLWTKAVLLSLTNAGASYVIGRSLLFNPKNVVAQAFQTRNNYWFLYELKKHIGIPSPFLMDTKNVAYKKNILVTKRVCFDPSFQIFGYDSADTDLGFQLTSKKIRGVYNPRMVISHEETPTVCLLIKKAYYRGMLAMQLSQKWNLKGEFIHLPDRRALYFLRRIKLWPVEFRAMLKNTNLNVWKKVVVFLLIKLHDFLFLRGFVRQAGLRNVDIEWYSSRIDR